MVSGCSRRGGVCGVCCETWTCTRTTTTLRKTQACDPAHSLLSLLSTLSVLVNLFPAFASLALSFHTLTMSRRRLLDSALTDRCAERRRGAADQRHMHTVTCNTCGHKRQSACKSAHRGKGEQTRSCSTSTTRMAVMVMPSSRVEYKVHRRSIIIAISGRSLFPR